MNKKLKVKDFLNRAFDRKGPKILSGFSRPFYHNVAGFIYGHRFDKKSYGGMLRHSEAAMLYLWAKELPPGATILEIGCYWGLSTSYLAAGIKGKKGSRLFSIDPFDSDLERQIRISDDKVRLPNKPSRAQVYDRLASHGLAEGVELIQGFSEDIAKGWERPIHLLWIDGNHNQTYQDYDRFRNYLTSPARVVVHDAHPRYGLICVADDVRKIFSHDEEWSNMDHVKSIITGIRGKSSAHGKGNSTSKTKR